MTDWVTSETASRPFRAWFNVLLVTIFASGCTSVNTFPTIARPTDTVSMMVGGTEKARKDTIQVQLTDSVGGVWDLDDPNGDMDRSDSLVRSVFNLRPDGRAKGVHYNDFLTSFLPWNSGHESTQAVLVLDIPAGTPFGMATIDVATGVDDDSSGVGNNFSINLEIVDVPDSPGGPDNFLRQDNTAGTLAVNFNDLEPAPYAKITFDRNNPAKIYAASIILDFDEAVVDPADLNLYSPVSTVRGSFGNTGVHGQQQRMVHWRQDGQKMYIDVIAPNGIQPIYLNLYVVHPDTVTGSPGFALNGVTVYDDTGSPIPYSAALGYFQ